MPRFCIVIPSYNSRPTIAEAVTSALAQRHDDFHVVFSDNASEDGTREEIEKFDDSRLNIYLHSTKFGKSANWNRAYAHAGDCEYLVNLHSDDRLFPDCLAVLDRARRAGRPVLLFGAHRCITYAGEPYGSTRMFPLSYTVQGETAREIHLLRNIIGVVGVAIRRDVFEKHGGWSTRYNFFNDVDLWYKLSTDGDVRYVAKVLGDYRDQPPGTNKLDDNLFEGLTWYHEQAESLGPGRLRDAALASLAFYVQLTQQSIRVNGACLQKLSEPLEKAKVALAKHYHRSVNRIFRQRWLRLLAGLKYHLGFS